MSAAELNKTPQVNLEYSPVSSWVNARVVSKEILRNLFGLISAKRVRGRDQVSADYDQRAWKDLLEEKRWLQCDSVREYVVPPDATLRIAKIENRLVHIRSNDYYAYRLRSLQAVLDKYAVGSDELVELGCGWGSNLFSAHLLGRWERLSGFDISQNGISAANAAAQHFGLNHIQCRRLDLTDSADPNWSLLRGKCVFTYYCLEQLKYGTQQIIDRLLRAGVRRVIHIEPTTELLKLFSPLDVLNYLYMRRMDYQDSLVKTLGEYKEKSQVIILDQRRLYYAPGPRNDGVLVCWEPATERSKH